MVYLYSLWQLGILEHEGVLTPPGVDWDQALMGGNVYLNCSGNDAGHGGVSGSIDCSGFDAEFSILKMSGLKLPLFMILI